MPDSQDPEADRDKKSKDTSIIIDKKDYKFEGENATGAQLRALASISEEYELVQIVPGGQDKPISDTETIELQDGMRFFSAPRIISPGRQVC
jgi:hypothetical protein